MGFFSRLFRREPPRPVYDRRSECGQWYVGDLAVCINGHWDGPATGPAKGEIRRVVSIRESIGTWQPHRAYFLILEGYGIAGYAAFSFRKVVQDDTSADAEFTAKIKACKPVKARA